MQNLQAQRYKDMLWRLFQVLLKRSSHVLTIYDIVLNMLNTSGALATIITFLRQRDITTHEVQYPGK